MEDLREYLKNTEKDYFIGVELLKKYGQKNAELSFFEKSDGSKGSFAMLIKKLQSIYRISSQQSIEKKTESKPAIQIGNKPIIIPKKHFSEVEPELSKSKMLTNKLLSRNWTELDQKEQNYFNNNQILFEEKKEALIENSKIESELKSLHAKMQLSKSDAERQEFAVKMVEIKKQQAINWDFIDGIGVKPIKEEKTAHIDKADLLIKRNNLRARISKLKKQTADPSAKKYTENISKLNACESELEELNKII